MWVDIQELAAPTQLRHSLKEFIALCSHRDVPAGKLAHGGCAQTAGGMLVRVIQMMYLQMWIKILSGLLQGYKDGHCVVANF